MKEIPLETCLLCHPELDPEQTILLSNEHCLFLQLRHAQDIQGTLAGAGIIVPKQHRETVFDLTSDEWHDTYALLHDAKRHIDEMYHPQGYNIGWNCGETGGQHLPYAHLHVLPRYADEVHAGKGIRHLFKGDSNVRGMTNP
ncbi:hydrolase [Sporosarcina sp. NCCP-2716]|uniref:HIT family protein n=1 Tax=Sporosarcina sp. NCCP-2716 TaxID=2943679 RepID=UPI00203DA499|nr:HIT domain-containing protein [Sporosarcina sp. NCCP-2716]GKV70186.1 hydrolase [Sporosarcina sp. NCCP-2716]